MIERDALAQAVSKNDQQTDTTDEAPVYSPLPALFMELGVDPDAAFYVAEQRALRALAYTLGIDAETLTVEDRETHKSFVGLQAAQFLDGLAAGLRVRPDGDDDA